MKHYFDFLIENAVINKEQYLEALLLQLSEAPSLAEIVCEHQMLSFDDQLKVFEIQFTKGLTYEGAIKSLNLWSENFARHFEDYSLRFCKSAYRCLIDLGYIDLKSLIINIDDYIATLHSHPDSLEVVDYAAMAVAAAPRASDLPTLTDVPASLILPSEQTLQHMTSEPDDIHEFEFKSFNKVMMVEFMTLMTKDFKINVLNLIAEIESSAEQDEIKTHLATVLNELNNVKNGTQFIGLEIAGKLMQVLCQYNSRHLEGGDISADAKALLVSLNRRTLEEMFFLKVYFELTLTEKPYWDKTERQQAFISIVKDAA